MHKLSHKIKLFFLRPYWFIRDIFYLCKNYNILKTILELEKEAKEYDLYVGRKENGKEILRNEGRLEMLKLLKEKLHEQDRH